MKPTRFLLACRAAAIPSLFCLSGIASAAPLYWDTNGDADGSTSVSSGSGANAWGPHNVWSTSADGNVATGAYVQDSDVFIAAGTNAIGTYIIRINGAQSANSITFEEGTVTLSSGNASGNFQSGGGSLSLGPGGLTLASGLHGTATIANGLGTLTLTADQSWTNNSTQLLEVQTGVAGTATTGNTQTLTLAGPATGTNGGITITSAGGAISDGSGGGILALTKEGNHTLTLSGNNTYTGLTTVGTGGILIVRHNNALGSSAAGTEVAANSSLRLENNVTVTGETLKITGTPLSGNSAGLINQSGNNVWTGDVTVDISNGNNARFSSNGGTLDLRGDVFIDSTGAASSNGTGLVLTGNGGVSTISGNISGTGNNQNLIKNGTSTWVLSGTNTYGGITRIDAGVLSISSFADNLAGSSSINLGENTTTGTLRYTGTGETVTRNFILRPSGANAGGGRIEQAGTGHLLLQGNIAANNGTTGKNITLLGSTDGTGEAAGNISDGTGSPTSLTKAGTGTWTLSGTAKGYSGATSVTEGRLNVSTALTNTSSVSVSNGTLALQDAELINDAAALNLGTNGTLITAIGTETAGVLTVSGPSALDLSLGASILNLANSSSADWTGGLLTILGWNGDTEGGGAEQIVFGNDATGLTETQLGQIQFSLIDGLYSARILATGEIVPDALIPEVSSAALALLGSAGLLARRRRK